jgi:hypothetical protein
MSRSAQFAREAKRDSTTALIGSVMTLISIVFEITNADAIAACTMILTLICHRGIKSI